MHRLSPIRPRRDSKLPTHLALQHDNVQPILEVPFILTRYTCSCQQYVYHGLFVVAKTAKPLNCPTALRSMGKGLQ